VSARTKLKLEGVITHPRKEWPSLTHGYGGRNVLIPQGRELHTTQGFVSPHVVEEKSALLRTGARLRVSLARDVTGRLWITDGHHALAAYHSLNETPRGFLYDFGSDVHVKAPRFRGGP
jgi:hypothetical protein